MVKAAEQGAASDHMTVRYSMAFRIYRRCRRQRRRDTWPKTHANPALVVMHNPSVQDLLQTRLANRNEEVQTLAANGAHEPFAHGIRPWCPHCSAQYLHSQSGHLLI